MCPKQTFTVSSTQGFYSGWRRRRSTNRTMTTRTTGVALISRCHVYLMNDAS
jgi:hypothetical protein